GQGRAVGALRHGVRELQVERGADDGLARLVAGPRRRELARDREALAAVVARGHGRSGLRPGARGRDRRGPAEVLAVDDLVAVTEVRGGAGDRPGGAGATGVLHADRVELAR